MILEAIPKRRKAFVQVNVTRRRRDCVTLIDAIVNYIVLLSA